jgi:hypothetical protein
VCVFLAIFTVGSRAHSVCGGEHAGSVRARAAKERLAALSLCLVASSL